MPSTASIVAATALVSSAAGAPTAGVSFGQLLGNSRSSPACDEFLGVPFAEAPVGDLRFAAPKPWSAKYPADGLDSTKAGSICLQSSGGSEDCLFLNVWRPSTASGANELLPVMAWIHGGAFEEGSGSQYDGCHLTTKGVLVASMNYRMGPFGYALFDDGETAKGNFGMKDQREALVFLQREVAGFGGDRSKVTIFGESAGGISVMYHVASPLSGGLFRAAISESGFPSSWGFSYARNVSRGIAEGVGCSGDDASLRDCMRKVDAKTLQKNSGEGGNPFTTAGWSPSVDHDDMPEYPIALFAKRNVNKVAFMAGTNTDEGNAFVWPFYPAGMYRESAFKSFVTNFANNHDPVQELNSTELNELFAKYPLPGGLKDKRTVAGQVLTDGTFLCGSQLTGWNYDVSDFFLYRFNHRSSCAPSLLPGIYHGMEIDFVFGNGFSCDLAAEEQALTERMQSAWTNFAKTLNPTPDATAETPFPKFTESSRKSLVFQTPQDEVEEDYRRDVCEFWNDLVFKKYLPSEAAPDVIVV